MGRALSEGIVKGLFNDLGSDRRIQKGCIGIVQAEEADWDDLSGKELDPTLAKEARKEELEEYKKHGVYEKVDIEECWDATGKAPIGVRWVDVNKGDEIHPEVRSRLVAKEINKGKNVELFAATPPLEAKKVLFSAAVTEGVGYWKNGEKCKLDIL